MVAKIHPSCTIMSSTGLEPDPSMQSYWLKITGRTIAAVESIMSVFQKLNIILEKHNKNVNQAVNHPVKSANPPDISGQWMFIHDR